MGNALVRQVDTEKAYEERFKVVELFAKGHNETQIAKQLSMRRVDVVKHLDAFRQSDVGSRVVRGKLEELMATVDIHYKDMNRQHWDTVNFVNDIGSPSPQHLSQKTAALKAIADNDARLIDIMQKSGMFDAADMTEEVEKTRENMQTLLQIMQDELCESCKRKVWDRLGTLTGKVEAVVVYG